ncbi:protein AGENET DOMAIN (AGD)-CONTAINING P1 isoform X2 [Lactuca sativa]|uniref:protein AGENET DOMAIN (AGD)-CONTAINING P1 isoform X2 n=1 Tax=Lactuca sativa TaxID=4236 RepID=UPI001C687A15|nr:protein AGENET DOMAIN (AGD)-CONTAINING P1 isoform X2 [Lactuca sativa]
MSTHGSCNHDFKKGDEIEVLRKTDDGDVPVWFPATAMNSPSPEGTLHVKFTTLYMERYSKDGRRKRKKIRDYVNVIDGVRRPVTQAEPHRSFAVGEEVETFHENGWRRGEVKEVLENSMYKVVIGGAVEVVVEKSRVRVYRDRSSFPSTLDPPQEKSSHLVLQSNKRTKLRIVCKSRSLRPDPFPNGTPVEVRSYEEGYQGSWYAAMVVGSIDETKILVQYETLKTDDEMQPLVEMADASNVRPLPPTIHRMDRFKMHEEVDAWYNDGWWVGHVSKILGGLKYAVYFWITNEEYEFLHSELRPHQELINEKWVASFLRPKLLEKPPRPEKVKLQTGGGRTLMVGLLRGLKVEIAHGENGFLTTWYPAVILGPVNKGKYLVEYRTLKTTDNNGLLKEEVDVMSMRPCPPIIQSPNQFQVNDRVDAWDFNGWQTGQVFKTMKEFKYAVYFWATKSVVEYRHDYLRLHQDFIDGESRRKGRWMLFM